MIIPESDRHFRLTDGLCQFKQFRKIHRATFEAVNPLKTLVRGKEFGIRIHNWCDYLTFIGLDIMADGHGVRLTKSNHITFLGCRFHHCGVEGATWGYSENIRFEKCIFEGNGLNENGTRKFWAKKYTQDKCHGAYGSMPGGNVFFHDCQFIDNLGSAIQLRCPPWKDNDYIETAYITECIFEGNGYFGTGAVSLMNARDVYIRDCTWINNNGGIYIGPSEVGGRSIVEELNGQMDGSKKFDVRLAEGSVIKNYSIVDERLNQIEIERVKK